MDAGAVDQIHRTREGSGNIDIPARIHRNGVAPGRRPTCAKINRPDQPARGVVLCCEGILKTLRGERDSTKILRAREASGDIRIARTIRRHAIALRSVRRVRAGCSNGKPRVDCEREGSESAMAISVRNANRERKHTRGRRFAGDEPCGHVQLKSARQGTQDCVGIGPGAVAGRYRLAIGLPLHSIR